MNKSHKSIWNESLGTYVAAAETANATGRKTSSGRKARRVPLRAHAGQLALEQRIVFDAALPATLVEAQTESAAGPDPVLAELDQLEAERAEAESAAYVPSESTEQAAVERDVVAASDEESEPVDELMVGEADEVQSVDAEGLLEDGLPGDAAAEAEMVEADETERVEIIFVDSVAAGVTEHLDWHPGEVYVLDANRDGVEQMAEILNGRSGIDAIHIISHGTPGRLELGNSALDTTSITGMHADELAIIRAALSEEADILLYGCDVSSSADGVAFVEALADATGADVAASSDDTGAEALGGDWVLETQVGDAIETTVIAATEWAGLLTTAINVGSGAFLGSAGMSIYSIDATTGKATQLTTVPATVGGVAINTANGINSLSVNHTAGLIYYTSNTSANTNVALFAYDYINNVHIVVDNNLTTGLATNVTVGATGVGSGAATFVDSTGFMYLGVENNQGGDGGGTTSDDTIYRLTFSADGRTVTGIATLVINITGNDWGDLGYNSANNTLQSSSLNGGTVNVTRYTLNAAGTSATNAGTLSVATTNTQASETQAGGTYLLSTAIQQYNPTTGALIGSAVNITTNGTTALGALNDAASWTPPDAQIGDRIFTDTNANGTFDGTDSGIAGVTVRLVDDVNNNGVVDAGERVLATDTSDASGLYRFTGVLPGNYIVQVTDTGNVLGAGRTYTTAGGNTNASADVTQIGSTNLAIDFGLNNRAPVNVVPGTQTMPEDGSLNITGVSTSDPDGNLATTQLTVTNGVLNVSLAGGATISSGANGGNTLTLSGTAAQINAALASIGYQPTANYFGPAVLTVRSTDVAGLQDTDTVNITVNAVNDPPVDGDETNTVTEDTTLTVANGAAGDLLNNTTDVDGGTPTITQFAVAGDVTTYTAGQSAVIAGVGSLTINGNGSYSFTPVANYTGAIPVATYTVSDGAGGSDTSTLTLTVVPVNDPPDAVNDTQAVAPQVATVVNLLGNDTDPDGDPLTVSTATLADPSQGTLTNVGGVWSFTSAAGVSGPVVINYTIVDQDGATDSATHTMNVANQPPVLVDPDPTPGTPNIDPTDPNNLLVPAVDNVPVSVDLDNYFTDPNTGDTLTITPDLSGVPAWVTYDPVTNVLGGTPPVDNAGPVTIPVTVNDGNGGSFTGTITIEPVNPGPDAVNDTQAVAPQVATVVNLLGNDTDPDGDPLTVSTATLADPSQGTLTNVGGVWSFTSAAGVSGPVVINYTIVDQDGATDSATHTMNVA
ncbi:tandem-95 repeat protein, partial [Hydrogenophaga sp. ZJX-1]|uniref:tandem-95 repeat protein n=1 Tax=Hydrogenophaga sp. ZJX-1 TaxID=3404778 RepID=UPI003B27EF6C